MKKNLLTLFVLFLGVAVADAQPVSSQKISKDAAPVRAQINAASAKNEVCPTLLEAPVKARKVARKADGVTPMYMNPEGAFYYGIADNWYRFLNPEMLTGGFDDITFVNYTRDAERNRVKDVTWTWRNWPDNSESNPTTRGVDEDGSLTVTGFGQFTFPIVHYGDASYSATAESSDGKTVYDSYWTAGTSDYAVFNFQEGVQPGLVGNWSSAWGIYSGFGDPLIYKTHQDFYTLQDYATTRQPYNTGKKTIGFAQYYSKPVSHVYATDIAAIFWVDNLNTAAPLNGQKLTAEIFTFDADNKMVLYASATADESDLTVMNAENQNVTVTFKFKEDDPMFGSVESPIVLPDEDFIVVLSGFEAVTSAVQSPIVSADGWTGGGYAMLEDGSFSCIGYTNDPQTPQVHLPIGFHAALPVLHYDEGNLEEVLFTEEGGSGVGMYDESEDKYYIGIYVETLSPASSWSVVEKPSWITIEFDEQYLEKYGIMTIDLKAEALPAGTVDREGKVVFELFGKQLEVPVYQMSPAGISNPAAERFAKSVSFNLAGQKVPNSFKGISIKDGKKYFVK